ncbi:MAG: hypothetical protein CFE21_06930 [Bacteroidetes bacterium B1(2017)]|nr:MAG: hypothetical protein CFE21_06930 [Bacteroidetes bacterium B1(2017)]
MLPKRYVYLQSTLFAILGIGLLYVSFRKTNFSELLGVIQNGNHWVLAPVFFVSVWVIIARSLRWQVLFNGIGFKAPFNVLLASLASGYLVNFAVPRLGEISRAMLLKKSLQYPINTSLGTIVFERIADVICLGIIICTAFLLEFLNHGSLLNNFTKDINLITPNKILVLGLLLGVGIVIYKWLKKRHDGFSEWITKLIDTALSLVKIKQKSWFLVHTISIWIGFYLMTYLWFFMFQDSAKLTMYDAFLVMVLGVVARTLPIQAGSAGAYHFVVSQAFVLLGLNLVNSNALAIVIHGFQTILTLLFGFTAYLWLFYYNKKNATKIN